MRLQRIEQGKEKENAERLTREYEAQLLEERQREEARREAAAAHKRDLIRQMQSNEEAKRRAEARAAEEAEEARRRERQTHVLLEQIRERKVKEMERDAIPDKYTVELRSKKSVCA